MCLCRVKGYLFQEDSTAKASELEKNDVKDDVSMVSDDLELSDDDSNDATKLNKKEEKNESSKV